LCHKQAGVAPLQAVQQQLLQLAHPDAVPDAVV
jgi:hypothetical protein